MSTDTTSRIDSTASSETFEVGEKLGRKCRGGELFLLASDLGGGKTTFTKGLAKGLGSTDTVSSPTFMVNKIYECRDGLKLYHFDFYRLNEPGMVGMELEEILADPKAVIAVEWGDIVTGQLPPERVDIRIERVKESEDARSISISLPAALGYLKEAL